MANATARFFLYTYCADLAAMREFYSELIGLEEHYFAEGNDGGLAYRIGNVQFTVLPRDAESQDGSLWARQPGWDGGEESTTSWSIELSKREAFQTAVARLIGAGVPRFDERPQWRSYWSFPVQDPMGNTVELTYAPREEPAEKTWPTVG